VSRRNSASLGPASNGRIVDDSALPSGYFRCEPRRPLAASELEGIRQRDLRFHRCAERLRQSSNSAREDFPTYRPYLKVFIRVIMEKAFSRLQTDLLKRRTEDGETRSPLPLGLGSRTRPGSRPPALVRCHPSDRLEISHHVAVLLGCALPIRTSEAG
jgi:hypothetical protein